MNETTIELASLRSRMISELSRFLARHLKNAAVVWPRKEGRRLVRTCTGPHARPQAARRSPSPPARGNESVAGKPGSRAAPQIMTCLLE